jgi:hypothetical protein
VVKIGFIIVIVIASGLTGSLAIDAVNRFFARKRVLKLLKNKEIHNSRALEKPERGMVYEDIKSLKVTNAQGQITILNWDEVEEVRSYKEDLFSVDLICVAFKKMGKDEYYEINEEMIGYRDLIETLPNRLPGFNVEWFSAVAFPAFKFNLHIIWKKSWNGKPQHAIAVET